MSVCPFCKASVGTSSGPCPKCGKAAVPDLGSADDGELELGSSSGSGHHGGSAASAYESGGGGAFDSFDSEPPPGMLELDLPPPKSGNAPPPPMEDAGPPSKRPGTSGQHAAVKAPSNPALSSPPSSQRGSSLPAGPSSERLPPAADASGAHAAHVAPQRPVAPVDPAAQVVAKYPPIPGAIWQAPIYACKVLWRQLELRQDLESLRRRRSPDVPLYERALKAHDKKTFTIGLAIVIAIMTVALVIFFLPVIIRFTS